MKQGYDAVCSPGRETCLVAAPSWIYVPRWTVLSQFVGQTVRPGGERCYAGTWAMVSCANEALWIGVMELECCVP